MRVTVAKGQAHGSTDAATRISQCRNARRIVTSQTVKTKVDVWASTLAWVALVEGLLSLVFFLLAQLNDPMGLGSVFSFFCGFVNLPGFFAAKLVGAFEGSSDSRMLGWAVTFSVGWLFWGAVIGGFRASWMRSDDHRSRGD